MAKRFTDTEKWKKQFFREATASYKLFWIFITDDCDHSGIWEVEDYEIIARRIGEKIDLSAALKIFNSDETRIHVFDNGRKWFIIPFVKFQYGKLGEANRLHMAVKDELLDKGLLDLVFDQKDEKRPVKGPLERVKDKEKEKDKDKDKDFGKPENLFDQEAKFEEVWSKYPSKDGKKDAIRHFCATVKTDADFQRLEKALTNYLAHLELPQNSYKQPKNGKTWFNNWQDWENWTEPVKLEDWQRKVIQERSANGHTL